MPRATDDMLQDSGADRRLATREDRAAATPGRNRATEDADEADTVEAGDEDEDLDDEDLDDEDDEFEDDDSDEDAAEDEDETGG